MIPLLLDPAGAPCLWLDGPTVRDAKRSYNGIPDIEAAGWLEDMAPRRQVFPESRITPAFRTLLGTHHLAGVQFRLRFDRTSSPKPSKPQRQLGLIPVSS